MPLKPGSSEKTIGHNIKEMRMAGHSEKQSVAAAEHNADKYAEGGEVDEEHETMMDHVAREAIDAIHSKDHETFKSSLHVLMADLMTKMSKPEGD